MSDRISIDDVYVGSSRFLRAADLQGNRVVVEIAKFELAELQDGKKQVVLHFKGKEKVLGLNVTNSSRIAMLIGSKFPDDWIGHKIKLYPTKDQMQGKQVDCIRVSEEYHEAPAHVQTATASMGTASSPHASVVSDDEVPF